MNTIWLKIAGVAVVAVVVLIVGSKFMSTDGSSGTAEEADRPMTFQEMTERDRQLTEPPKPAAATETPTAQEPEHVQQQTAQAPEQTVQPSAQTAPRFILPSDITKPTTLYFKPLGEIEEIEAERILPVAGAGLSIGRLPGPQYRLMIDGCRQILQKWPDSWYAFRAKQMMESMPERFRDNYKVTEQEMDISAFVKQRRGTQPFTVEPMR